MAEERSTWDVTTDAGFVQVRLQLTPRDADDLRWALGCHDMEVGISEELMGLARALRNP